jgi:hypothetical protein
MGAGSGKSKPAKVRSVVPTGSAEKQNPAGLTIELPEDNPDAEVDDSIAASDLLRDDYYEEYDDGSASTASKPRPTPLNLSPRNQKNDSTRQGYLQTRKIARLQLEEAAAGNDLNALKAALRRAQELGLAGRELAIAHEALTRVEAEERDKKNSVNSAKKALQSAIAAKDLDALQPALQRAMQLGLPKEDTKPALDALQAISIDRKSMRDVVQTHRDALAAAMKRSIRKDLDLTLRKAADAGLPAEDLEPARKLLLELEGKTEEENGPLPTGWREHFDIATGFPYYELISSGEVFWERPTADMAVAEVQAPPQLPEGWETVWDEGYQAYYYCNGELGVSQWEPPSPAAMPHHHQPNIWTDVHSNTPPPPFDLPCQPMEDHAEPVAADRLFQPPIIGWSAPTAAVYNGPKIGIATRLKQMRKERAENHTSQFEATPSPTSAVSIGEEALQFVCDNCGAPRLVTGAHLASGNGTVTCTLCQWVGVPSQITRQHVVEKNKEITRKKAPPKPPKTK